MLGLQITVKGIYNLGAQKVSAKLDEKGEMELRNKILGIFLETDNLFTTHIY